MKIFQYKLITFILLCLLSFVSGCSLPSQVIKVVDKSQSPQVLTSTDNFCQITIPGNWGKIDNLHEEAVIQAGNKIANQYVIIIRENKEDFGKKFTLDSLTTIARDNFKEGAEDSFFTEPIPVKINEYQARQFEASGEIDNIKTKYLYGIVETPNNYYQIIIWTINSKFENNKDAFLEILNSFKETGTDNSTPSSNSSPSSNIKKSNSKK